MGASCAFTVPCLPSHTNDLVLRDLDLAGGGRVLLHLRDGSFVVLNRLLVLSNLVCACFHHLLVLSFLLLCLLQLFMILLAGQLCLLELLVISLSLLGGSIHLVSSSLCSRGVCLLLRLVCLKVGLSRA